MFCICLTGFLYSRINRGNSAGFSVTCMIYVYVHKYIEQSLPHIERKKKIYGPPQSVVGSRVYLHCKSVTPELGSYWEAFGLGCYIYGIRAGIGSLRVYRQHSIAYMNVYMNINMNLH